MKRYLGSLATVLLFGASILGLSATAYAQYPKNPPQQDSQQQPEEIPAQYPPQQPQQGMPPQGGPQQGMPPQANQQPPQDGPGAARISFIHGDLTTQHSDSTEWIAATLNTPVVPGDHVSTGKNSRGEIQLDHANILRLSDESSANIVTLSRTQIQLQVAQGLVNYDVLRGSEADTDIQTPNVAIHPQAGESSFRIQVNSDNETIIDVRKGSADISTPQGSTHVDRDQRITIEGNADNAQYNVAAAYSKDDWDKWNSDRDRLIESAASWQHTNPYYTGSQDLDTYGQWNSVPDYGSVWFPAAAPGWAPYRDGRWVFEPYYGWTWVSYEPWGWAPYHYGRWFVYGGRWGWWPGPVYVGYRPLWAPAYVSFLGFGGAGWGVSVGFGFGGGFGSIGWLPIGPGDRFYPWYGRGVTRVNVVNVYNVHNNFGGGVEPLRGGGRGFSNVDRAFNDERVRSGISSMGADQFGRGRVPTQQQRFDAGSLRQASMMTGANPVRPSSESFRPTDRQVSSSAIPNRTSANQRFYSPSGQNAQQNAARPGFRSFNPTSSSSVNSGSSAARQYQGSTQGQRSFNAASSQQGQSIQSTRPGWRTFTPPSSGTQPNTAARSYGSQSGMQSRSYTPQPAQQSRQYQNYSRGSSSNNYGYSRPPLNMQQPVVTPRSYSAPQVHSAPSGGGSRGGYSGGGSHGGGGSSSGHGHH
jgi:uncharacterized protein DUF6600/FecR-like protein